MKRRKFLASILCIALVLSTVGLSAFAAGETVSEWDGTYPEKGTIWCTDLSLVDNNTEDVYHIGSAQDFAAFANIVNTWDKTTNPFKADKIYLDVDIALKGYDWIPIGPGQPREKNRFYGSFYGQGHTISNLKVKEGYYYAGLFGKIPSWDYSQVIDGITIHNAIVKADNETVKNKDGAGALVGGATGAAISDCHVTGTINIKGEGRVGGLVGDSYAQISNCSVEASGTIEATTEFAGGLIGQQNATAGQNESISGCVVTGDATQGGLTIKSDKANVGGLVGNVAFENKTETTIDEVSVASVSVTATSAPTEEDNGIAYVAAGYFATNAVINEVEAIVAGEETTPSDSENVSFAVAEVGGEYFTDLAEAFKAVNESCTIEILSNVTIDTDWQCNFGRGISSGTFNNNEVTINGNDHVIKFTGKMTDRNTKAVISTGAPITVNDLTFDLSECPDYLRVISARTSAVIDNCTFIGNPENASTTYAVIVGESGGDMLANTTLTVTDSDFVDFNYGISDNRNDVDIKALTINGNEFNNASVQVSASEAVNFNNNEMTDSWVRIRSFTPADTLVVTATGNTLESNGSVSEEQNYIRDGKIVTDDEHFVLPTATIGVNGYFTITDAINAAEEDDVIIIAPGTYDAFTVPAEKNNLTFVGETDSDGNNLVTIRTNEDDIATATTGIYVQAEKATFKNLNLVSGSFIPLGTSGKEVWMASAIGSVNGSVGAGTSNLKDLTIENCNFKGNDAKFAVWVRVCDLTMKNSTIDGYTWGVETYATEAEQAINIINTEMTNVGNAIHTVNTIAGSKVNVKDSVIDAQQIHVSGESSMKIEGSEIKNADVKTYGKIALTITDSALYSSSFSTNDENSSISLSEVYVDSVNDIVDMADVSNISFTSYYSSEEDLAAKVNLIPVKEKASGVYVQFKKIDTAEDKEFDKYEIILAGKDSEKINELASADLTFDYTLEAISDGDMSVTVLPAEGVTLSQTGKVGEENRYMFNYDGINKDEETGATIVIGTVTVDGYGEYTLGVKEVGTNAVYATKIVDNIVDGFTPAAGLVVNEDMIENDGMVGKIDPAVTIDVPTYALHIDIDFPNMVNENEKAYQAMSVSIVGGNIDKTIDLGSDAVDTDNLYTATVERSSVTTDAHYTIKVKLPYNTTYTVTVEGAGYRTARHSVTLTEAKTLKFWNNVMTKAEAIEAGKPEVYTNFLAGDIVKDNKINVYDLSAVVSYFGTEGLSAANHPEYAKYDLNRDGLIDSRDVAYILVSWNN